MSSLALYFLGAPRIERNGELMEVDTRKALALVAYLAVTRRAHSRDTLAALLWPEYDDQHARGALRRTLSALRGALGGEWLTVAQDQVGLRFAPELWIDVERFEAAVSANRGLAEADLAELAEAISLYRDDFLAGFTLRDSPSFDDWQFAQGESLRRELSGALERLVQGHRGRGAYEQAIAYARRRLMLDPLHEPAHRDLMQLYVAAGQRNAALRQYNECVRILQQELGVAPLEETTQLYREIKERREAEEHWPLQPPAPAPGNPRSPGRLPGSAEPPNGTGSSQAPARQALRTSALPFVGRAAEWAGLQQAYAAAAGGGHLIVLEGEAGIGKTRLAEEFLNHVAGLGAATATARCYQGETNLAYAPFVEALRGVLNRPDWAARRQTLAVEWLAEASRLLPEVRGLASQDWPAPAPLDSPGAQARFLDGVSQVLAAGLAAQTTAGVLFLDDVQWMDGASLDLLAYLIRRLRGQSLLVLLAWRRDQVPANHALRRSLAEAQRAGSATLLTLPRLDTAALDELIGQVSAAGAVLRGLAEAKSANQTPGVQRGQGQHATLSAHEDKASLAERLYRETEGLPFFIAEYLAALAGGTLSTKDSGWVTPEGVRDLIHARLATVSDAGRQLLSTAALLGRSFDFDTLRDVSGRTDEETIAGLEELVNQGLIREVTAGRLLPPATAANTPAGRPHDRGPVYDFAHDKLCDVVYEETSLARRRLLHRRVAETLVNQMRSRAGRPGQTGRDDVAASASIIAQHYSLAGQENEAAEYYRLAGAYARSLYANREALAHFEAALALGHPDQAGLHEASGDMQTLLGDYGAALRSYEAARALAAASAPVTDQAAAGTAGRTSFGLPGEIGLSGPGLADGGQSIGAAARLEHKLGMLHLRRGEWVLAAGHLRDALAGIPETANIHLRSHLYADWSLAAHRQGRDEEAQALAQRAFDLATEAGDRKALAQVENTLGMLAKGRGDLSEACRHLEASLALAEELGDAPARVAALNNLALSYAETGETGRALALTEQALALCVTLGDRHREAALHNNLADLFHARGDREAAMGHLKQAVAIFAEIRVEADDAQPEIWKLAEW